ncbi:PEP-CTERM sorting domain-containing protein [Pontiellaceae bacterium B12219]|nr:PEP-CTERM sorting domain-containing protein [Pontiellaceae bacterium B12219]
MKTTYLLILSLTFLTQSVCFGILIDYSTNEKAVRIDFIDSLASYPFEEFCLTLDFDTEFLGNMGFFSTIHTLPEGSSFRVGYQHNVTYSSTFYYINPTGPPPSFGSSLYAWNEHTGSVSTESEYMYVYSDNWNLNTDETTLYIKPIINGTIVNLTNNFYYTMGSDSADSSSVWTEVAVIPEPSTISLIAGGCIAIYTFRNRRKSKAQKCRTSRSSLR